MSPTPAKPSISDQLLAPFPPESISQLPKGTCRACSNSARKRCDDHQWVAGCTQCHGNHSSATIHLSYVGHADVTRRLLEVDPDWSWEPFALDQSGLPMVTDLGMWIRLTVAGVTRIGFGDANGKTGPSAVKEIIGDAIRNAAMRFGVAVDLWSKSDAAAARQEVEQAAPPPPNRRALAALYASAAVLGIDVEDITEKFRHAPENAKEDGAPMEFEELDTLADPWRLQDFSDAVARFAVIERERKEKTAREQAHDRPPVAPMEEGTPVGDGGPPV